MLFALALVFSKRSQRCGSSTWMVVYTANNWAAVFFSILWFTEPATVPWHLIWQPILVGFLYIAGQSFTFLALERGDVSVAAPVLSSKVVIVAVLVTVLAQEPLPSVVWCAVVISMLGIILAQRTDRGDERRGNILFSVFFAICAATTFSFFDLLVQQWASDFGSSRFLPIVFWVGAILSLGYLPFIDHSRWKLPGVIVPLMLGTVCIGLQAICIVCALAYFQDAVAINVVYALRALWGVVFAWALARRFQMDEQHISKRTMIMRLIGALLLTVAVIMCVTSKAS